MKLLLVGIGGFVGSIARYALGSFVQDLSKGNFPVGTLAVNVLGCFAIGVISQLSEARAVLTSELRALVIAGFLGGFTTFSAFGNETLDLLRERGWMLAGTNVAAHIALAIGSVWVGRISADLIWK